MPLKVMDLVEQRLAVLTEPQWSGRSVAEVCARHGISRDTFYAWKRRYEQEVPAASTVQQVLARRGLAGRPRRRPVLPGEEVVHRFERSASNELWQIDGAHHR